jgi:peptidoglycan/LPS O-acetylase OafA/YrhL
VHRGAYRRDIDGLRAIAVIAVVLHHLRTGFSHGGYVGVDVFFVISGYLITGIVHEEVVERRFSLSAFYERRVRRIFPALFALVVTCVAVGWVVLLPGEFETFGRSVVATTLFASNFFFMSQQGYFDPGVAARPLLHTWSLAVEEQFYLVFPLFLVFVFRAFRERFVLCTAILALLSFALSVLLVARNPDMAFYSSPGRAWELLLGALVALRAFPVLANRLAGETLGVIGLVCLAASIALFRESTPFPGAAALVPTVGSALIIYSGMARTTLVGALLGTRVFVFFGLISYSLYLWHWPIVVFGRLIAGHELGKAQKLSAFAACIVAATLSWYFIERPFRKRGWPVAWPRLARMSGAAMAAFCIAGTAIALAHGMPGRFSPRVNELAAFAEYDASALYRQDRCFLTLRSPAPLSAGECLTFDDRRPDVLLMGDSHAADLWPGLSTTFPKIHFLEATATNCKPLLNDTGAQPCRDLMQYLLRRYIREAKPDAVIISVDWALADLRPLLATVASIQSADRPVIVFGQVPSYQIKLPRLLAMAAAHGDSSVVAAGREKGTRDVDREFARALPAAGIRYVSLYDAMCAAECASVTEDGIPLQWDESHFTEAGSAWVADRVRRGGLFP